MRIILDWDALAEVLRKPHIIAELFGTSAFDVSHHQEFTANLNGDMDDIGVAIEARSDNGEDTP